MSILIKNGKVWDGREFFYKDLYRSGHGKKDFLCLFEVMKGTLRY